MASQAGSVEVTLKSGRVWRHGFVESVVTTSKFLTLRTQDKNYHYKLSEVVSYEETRRL